MAAPKPDARAQAVALRLQGWSYSQILEVVDASPGSLSLWLRDVPLTEEQRRALASRQVAGVRAAAIVNRSRRVERQRATESAAAAEIGALNQRELFLLGVGLYRAEGSKPKPWATSTRVKFINSDPSMVSVFLRWLDLVGVPPEDRTYAISIHESADVHHATEVWSEVVGVPPTAFHRPSLKRHNPTTRRKNTGDEYVGCLIVSVRRSTDLNRRIAGWWAGIVDGIEAAER